VPIYGSSLNLRMKEGRGGVHKADPQNKGAKTRKEGNCVNIKRENHPSPREKVQPVASTFMWAKMTLSEGGKRASLPRVEGGGRRLTGESTLITANSRGEKKARLFYVLIKGGGGRSRIS